MSSMRIENLRAIEAFREGKRALKEEEERELQRFLAMASHEKLVDELRSYGLLVS